MLSAGVTYPKVAATALVQPLLISRFSITPKAASCGVFDVDGEPALRANRLRYHACFSEAGLLVSPLPVCPSRRSQGRLRFASSVWPAACRAFIKMRLRPIAGE